MKLFLIDAYALIYRSYYAFIKNPRINSKGVNTSAIFGFINSLEDVLKRENPTHIAVAFDPKGPTFRHEAFEQYKAQREETPEVIRQSVPIIKEIIEAYNIPILEVPRYEADDVIGTVSKQAEKEGFEVNYFFPDDYGVPKYYEGIFLASDDMIGVRTYIYVSSEIRRRLRDHGRARGLKQVRPHEYGASDRLAGTDGRRFR